MSTISTEQAKDLRNAFECWQQDYDPVEDKEQYEMFGLAVVAMDELLALRKERERAEPVEHESHIRREVNAGGNTWIQCSKQAFEREKARGALCRVLYESPPAPVVPAETFEEWSRRCEIQLTLCRQEFREVAEITWNACRAAMLAAAPVDVNDDSLPYDPQIAEYEQMMEAELKAAARTAYKVKIELSQMAEELVRDTTALAVTQSAETDTTAQQFESLAGKAVGNDGFECTPVADLYELLTKCGECYDYTTSAKVAAAWIKDGYSAREYVKLDRLQEALLFAAHEPCK
ncbi:hypothetical protein [Cronobacter sakazakii]|uniref:hypothetical protein n=1 Tax=Cronobacter sakazakii TaxID=28141 RepID=UPI0018F8A400|nr:hypothetical protein [Cronobacter sakazakii]